MRRFVRRSRKTASATALLLAMKARPGTAISPNFTGGYAQRTVDMASARLWLMEGTSIADVVAMLESRRQPEIPAALCSARAREIAATAQRMIARNKVA